MKHTLSFLLKITAISVALAAYAPRCAASVLINFDAGPGALQTGQAVLGLSSTDVWNSIDNAFTTGSDTYTGLVDSGSNSLTGVAFTRSGTHYDGHGIGATLDMDPATTNLMQDYLWTFPGNSSVIPVVWTLSGLSAYAGDAFTFVIYSAGDTGGGTGNSTFTLSGSNGGASAGTSDASRRISDGPGVAYVVLSGTVNASGQVQVSQSSSNVTPFNGAQIQIVPEPNTWAMLIGCGGVLVFCSRLRRFDR